MNIILKHENLKTFLISFFDTCYGVFLNEKFTLGKEEESLLAFTWMEGNHGTFKTPTKSDYEFESVLRFGSRDK